MENVETRPPSHIHPNHNNKLGGLVLIIIGVLFLFSKLPQTAGLFPHWFFTWPVLLIGIGIFVGVKHRFRTPGWFILMLIGGYFLLSEQDIITFNLRPYIIPTGIILLGIFLIFKKNRFRRDRCKPRWQKHGHPYGQHSTVYDISDTSEDIINVSSTFGSVERNVFSKNFKGGNISTAFGGVQVNFAQADFQGTAIVDVSIIFGGADIIIPSNWNLKNEISVVFGGIEDRRTVAANVHESGKTLILKGNIMFGGIEIKSY